MSLICLVLVFATGLVLGAKNKEITLFFYEKIKPTLLKWKSFVFGKFGRNSK